MLAVLDEAHSDLVTERESRGTAIQRRLDALGISDREFSNVSGVDRKTLRRAVDDDPSVRPNTLRIIEESLTELEAKMRGLPTAEVTADPSSRIFVIRLKNDVGEVVLEGPPENQASMVADARRLLDYMRTQDDD